MLTAQGRPFWIRLSNVMGGFFFRVLAGAKGTFVATIPDQKFENMPNNHDGEKGEYR